MLTELFLFQRVERIEHTHRVFNFIYPRLKDGMFTAWFLFHGVERIENTHRVLPSDYQD